MNSRLLLLAFAAVSLALPASALGTAQPDLVVKKLSNPPASLKPGDQVKVQLTVSNKGATAGGSAVRVYLSKDAKAGGDIALTGSPKTKGLKKGASAKVSATAIVPAEAKADTYFLLACADGAAKLREKNEKNNCRASANPAIRP
jgi:subtilase family serine protease